MKEQIENMLKLSGLKYWKAFAVRVGRDPSNFKRMLFLSIDRINIWLKEIGLELCVKEIEVHKEQKLTNGYVRLYGAESAADLDEIIPENELKERALQIYSEHTDEDAYYNYLKFLWVEYPNGNELQLMEVIPIA